MTKRLMEGSEAIAEAAIACGCRFFAGYPMTPFTELLENFAKKLPAVGGVCVNAESELEAVGMAWGALATGARAATGSTGQGLSLMQESFSEITLAELPLVAFNMARGQGDYFQSTRGGGHGDYRHIVLAPMDIGEAVELTQLAFHLADVWRTPVLVQGDYLLAHTAEAVDVTPLDFGPPVAKEWAVDGSTGGSGGSKVISPLGIGKTNTPGPGIEGQQQAVADKMARIADGEAGGAGSPGEARAESSFLDDAEHVVVAFGTPAKFVRYAVRRLRDQGLRVGYVRPITLWPFPADAVAAAATGKRSVLVFELNAGQMIDDVRLAVLGRADVRFIGGISTDHAGFGVGALLDVEVIARRIEAAISQEHEGVRA
ncbi:MAG: hypothetical protein JO085_09515 [Acidimicrobiia bacterium]|nr:hypothetical protein [Acidimicrobiia bacterium]